MKSNIELQLDAKINVSSTIDTVVGQFKQGVLDKRRMFVSLALTPLTSGQSMALHSLIFFQEFNDEKEQKWPTCCGYQMR